MKVETTSLLTVKSFAKELSFSTTYIYRLIKIEKIPAIDIDGVLFIRKAYLKKFKTQEETQEEKQ